MWTVVYMSQTEEKALSLAELLTANKIISRIHNTASGAENGCYEVLVPQTELLEAQSLIFENEF